AQVARDRANKNLEVATASQLRTIEEQRADYDRQLEMLELEIELAEIDRRAIKPPEGSSNQIIANYGGRIISVDKRIGQYAGVGERIAIAGVESGRFICTVAVPEETARFIEIGDTASVRQSGSDKPLDGLVTDIVLEGDTLLLKLTLVSEELNGGEYVQVKFTKQSMEYDVVVPAEAVISDPVSSYVWVLESKRGALGMEYYTRKVNVLIADKDGYYTAISAGLDNYQPVVLSYDKEPVVNGRVSRME
ncbi:MAG: hypothetical protein LBV33_03675, partial [Lachnospiraceae bacterium]|nr:hypothetical protein [Lachnospiraceae bacterium]